MLDKKAFKTDSDNHGQLRKVAWQSGYIDICLVGALYKYYCEFPPGLGESPPETN